jgi:hypothetical protein
MQEQRLCHKNQPYITTVERGVQAECGLFVTSLLDAHSGWRHRADELPDT